MRALSLPRSTVHGLHSYGISINGLNDPSPKFTITNSDLTLDSIDSSQFPLDADDLTIPPVYPRETEDAQIPYLFRERQPNSHSGSTTCLEFFHLACSVV